MAGKATTSHGGLLSDEEKAEKELTERRDMVSVARNRLAQRRASELAGLGPMVQSNRETEARDPGVEGGARAGGEADQEGSGGSVQNPRHPGPSSDGGLENTGDNIQMSVDLVVEQRGEMTTPASGEADQEVSGGSVKIPGPPRPSSDRGLDNTRNNTRMSADNAESVEKSFDHGGGKNAENDEDDEIPSPPFEKARSEGKLTEETDEAKRAVHMRTSTPRQEQSRNVGSVSLPSPPYSPVPDLGEEAGHPASEAPKTHEKSSHWVATGQGHSHVRIGWEPSR